MEFKNRSIIVFILFFSWNMQPAQEKTMSGAEIQQSVFATAAMMMPLMVPVPLFDPQFFAMLINLFKRIIDQIIQKISPAQKTDPATKQYVKFINDLRLAVGSSTDSNQIATRLKETFNDFGPSFYKALADAYSKSVPQKAARDFAVIKESSKGLRYIAEESIFINLARKFVDHIATMPPEQQQKLFKNFLQAQEAFNEGEESTLVKDLRQYTADFADKVFTDSMLAVLLYNEGVKKGLDIPLAELIAYIEENPENLTSIRTALEKNIDAIYSATKETATTPEALNKLLADLSKGVDLTTAFKPFHEKVDAYAKVFDQLKKIMNESTDSRTFQEKFHTVNWDDILKDNKFVRPEDIGKLIILLSSTQDVVNTYADSELNISFKRDFLRVDPSLANYIKVMEPVNFAGRFAGDYGVFDILNNKIFKQVTTPQEKYALLFATLDQDNAQAVKTFIREKLANELPTIAKNYIADHGLALVILHTLKKEYSSHEYSYREVMQLIQKVKEQNPQIVDKMVEAMQKTLPEQLTITNLNEFNAMIERLSTPEIKAMIPEALIKDAVKKIRPKDVIRENVPEDLGERISTTEERTGDTSRPEQPAQTTLTAEEQAKLDREQQEKEQREREQREREQREQREHDIESRHIEAKSR